jgi:hypothetical protein
MAFRIGRKHAQHTYPENRGGAAAALFARNFAEGPLINTTITDGGIQIPWAFVESGAPAGVNVPITPRSSGILRISGVIVIASTAEVDRVVSLVVQVNGASMSVPLTEANTVTAGGFEVVAFATETLALPIGPTYNVQIFLNASAPDELLVEARSSTIEVQEILAATG